ncbi:hypothetical protein [Legionella nagasakiensis]|uniref:hypothetical protein n=1 Tax=Legionella nagasakiensis TaxID=535290 RepID=UPI00105557C6|nr:hypothetical protein [Legionella nagasakiensis]
MSKKAKLNKNKLKRIAGGMEPGSGLTPREQFWKDNSIFNKDLNCREIPSHLMKQYNELPGK